MIEKYTSTLNKLSFMKTEGHMNEDGLHCIVAKALSRIEVLKMNFSGAALCEMKKVSCNAPRQC